MKPKHWLFDWSETIVVAFILALIIRAFFLQVFWIPSGSMEPTLDIRDRLIVNKVAYHFRQPRRFEIVVFRQVSEGLYGGNNDLIKRVIGLPGETVELKQGKVFVNGSELFENHLMNHDYMDFGPVVVPKDAYFMMGDNRPESADSRYWGFLPKANLIGPALVRIWPINRLGLI